jgi:REP element-mobilizing transposase RayT
MSYLSVMVHYVWGTKNMEPLIRHDWQDNLYAYIGGIVKNKRGTLVCAGGMADHVHLYVALPATTSIAQLASAIKSNSSSWIHETIPKMKGFHWQEKYGAFSVSKSGDKRVIEYIKNQKEHHRVRSFQEEFVAFLDRHGVKYDPKYLWE